MYAGRIVEEGDTDDAVPRARAPLHPPAARRDPDIDRAQARSSASRAALRRRARGRRAASFAPRCELAHRRLRGGAAAADRGRARASARAASARPRCARTAALVARRRRRRAGAAARGRRADAARRARRPTARSQIVHDVDLHLERRECLALVGESGSGKTTLARSIAGLHARADGRDPARRRAARDSRPAAAARTPRKRIQYVFQNPYSSLNPRRTVGESVARPLALLGIGGRGADAAGGGDAGARLADRRPTRTATPTSSPAASASASRSPGRWSASPTCWSATR